MYRHDEIELYKLQKNDLWLLWALKQESGFATHRVTINTPLEQQAWFDTLDSHPTAPRNLVLMADHDSSPKVGIFKVFGIDYQNRTADVGWDIFEEFRGRGLGKPLVTAGTRFCFDVLNLHRLTAEILENNVASLKCAKHAGYVQEGIKRQAVHKPEGYLNSHVLGILDSD